MIAPYTLENVDGGWLIRGIPEDARLVLGGIVTIDRDSETGQLRLAGAGLAGEYVQWPAGGAAQVADMWTKIFQQAAERLSDDIVIHLEGREAVEYVRGIPDAAL